MVKFFLGFLLFGLMPNPRRLKRFGPRVYVVYLKWYIPVEKVVIDFHRFGRQYHESRLAQMDADREFVDTVRILMSRRRILQESGIHILDPRARRILHQGH